MQIKFSKFHGAGNDFILIDNRNKLLNRSNFDSKVVRKLCNRRFGIGADGLMLLQSSPDNYDFEMKYYNSDGSEGAMCGNGGRCIAAFALKQGVIELTSNKAYTRFNAVDGEHEAFIWSINPSRVKLKMINVDTIENHKSFFFIDTGAPHYVEFCDDIETVDVFNKGRKIRYDSRFEIGTNVNFAQKTENGIKIRTYERGVENETLACGTGSVATAIAWFMNKNNTKENVENVVYNIFARGGNLEVQFNYTDKKVNNIWLTGEAKHVFDGEIHTKNLF